MAMAVRSLQFEDLVSRISSAVRRTSSFINELSSETEYHMREEELIQRTVVQSTMDEGEIELFRARATAGRRPG